MFKDLASIYNSLLLEFSEPAILRFIQKFKSDAIDEQTIRRYLKDFERYKNNLTIKDPGQYKTFMELEQAVDAAKGKAEFKKRNINVTGSTSSMEAEAIVNDDDVTIYKGDDEHKCVKYGNGYSFCISRPGGGNMYSSYRLQKASTFYFIFFKKTPKTDPKHIMVLDRTDTGWEWTFGNNNTKIINGGWDEVIEQFPVLQKYESLFVNKPTTEKEKKDTSEINSFAEKQSLEKFNSYDYELKNRIVKSGITLKDDIFKALDKNLLNEYISSGTGLTKYQADSLSPPQVERYRKVRAQTIGQFLQTNAYEFRPSKLDIGLSDNLQFDSDTNTYKGSGVDNKGYEFVTTKYDINGNLIYYIDHANGFEEVREYDDRGNMIYYFNPECCEYWYVYDKNNNKIYEKNSDGAEYWYDDQGEIIDTKRLTESKNFKSFLYKYYIV